MSESRLKKPLTIPVMIDDIKDQLGFQMSRCTYLSIASNAPSPEIALDPRINLPSILVGFTSVICRPSNRSLLFDDTRKISGLFERVESSPGLYVDINDLWLPNFLFDDLNRKRSSVYRIDVDLFRLAFGFQNERIADKDFLDRCRELSLTAEFSPKETAAFSKWSRQQIEHARKYYKANPVKWLKTPEKLREVMK